MAQETKEYLGKQTVTSLIRLIKSEFAKYAKKEDLGDMETALDSILTIQNKLIGGDEE